MDDVRAMFGDQLLSYMLALHADELHDNELTAEQQGIVTILREWLRNVATQHPHVQRISLTDAVLAYVPDVATTFANAARRQCGGQIPNVPDATDTVLHLLFRLGRDIYPGLLLSSERDQLGIGDPSVGAPLFRHPLIDEFCRSAYTDHALQQLFPGDYSHLDPMAERALIGIHSELIFSSGHGGGFQLISLASRVLLAAYYRTLLAGPLSPAAYLSMVEPVLYDVRQLASGQSCDIPVIFGLSNVDLPPDTEVTVPWGTLLSPARVDNALIPRAATVTAVLLAKCPLKILHVSPFDPQAASEHPFAKFERYRPQMEMWSTETDRIGSLMRLAFLLASPDEGFYAARSVSRTLLDPFRETPAMQWNTAPPFAPSPMAGLSDTTVTRVKEWAEKTNYHPKRLGIAMRRTLSAVSDRTDPLDGFIDAVMAWENMFSGRPETNLRVCGAIAWLLEPDGYDQRSQLFSELKDLYTKRSNLVHGAVEAVDDAAACRDRAVRIAIESMRQLYANPELLAIKSSTDRGGAILLGAAGGKPPNPIVESLPSG